MAVALAAENKWLCLSQHAEVPQLSLREQRQQREQLQQQGRKDREKAADSEAMKINVIAKGFQAPVTEGSRKKGAMQAGSEFNAGGFLPGTGQQGPLLLLSRLVYLDAAIAQKPTAICLAAADTKACIGSIEECYG